MLDDIFSAVDAHVGRQLFEEALAGKLGRGRTRILVTHHVGLCISKTVYTVKLEEGRVVYAGSVDALRQSGDLQEILKDDAAIQEEEEEAIEELPEDNGDGGQLKRILSRRLSRRRSSVAALVDQSSGAATKKQEPPKKFTEIEGREVGRIKTHVYMEYIKQSGGLKIWLPLLGVFLVNMVLPLARVSVDVLVPLPSANRALLVVLDIHLDQILQHRSAQLKLRVDNHATRQLLRAATNVTKLPRRERGISI